MPTRDVSILVVDDESALLESMRAYLSRLGHKVTAFRNATAAWENLTAQGPSPTVVIVDLTLQGMSGAEFIGKVLNRDPTIAVLATSGYPESLASLDLPPGARAAMLQQPFAPRMLDEAIERLLGTDTAAAPRK